MQQVNPPLFEYQDHAYQRTEWSWGLPLHVGIYERDYSHADVVDNRDVGIAFCHWDGTNWFIYGENIAEAAETGTQAHMTSNEQDLPWRGLTRPVMERLA